jgi:hypothetical protein
MVPWMKNLGTCPPPPVPMVVARACERSGKWSGAGRKTNERERSGERDFEKREEREIRERERSGERAMNRNKFP